MTSLSFIELSSDGTAEIHYPLTLDPNNQSTTMELFGRTSDVVVKDQAGNLVKSSLKENLKEIEIDSSGLLGASLNYNTSDLTKKSGQEWTFSLISPMRISLIFPFDSHISSWGTQNPLIITQDQNRNMITFDPGNITVKYSIVGQAPTRDEAIISIDSAQVAIQETKDKKPGIALTGAEDILQQAISAKDDRQYQSAIELGNKAKDMLSNITKEYDNAQSEIKKADRLLHGGSGWSSSSTKEDESLLGDSKDEFARGNYAKSQELVIEIFKKRNSTQHESGGKNLLFPETSQYAISSVVVVVVVVAVVAIIYGKYKKKMPALKIAKTSTRIQEKLQDEAIVADPNNTESKSSLNPKVKDSAMNLKDPVSTSTDMSIPDRNGLRRDTTAATPHPPTTPDGSSVLPFLSIVERVLEERPYMKQEDKQVLRFIAEKGGTAFESEIRNKFILPKTTLWRLVKRLERENLVEVRKTGVQNLIELRYSAMEDDDNVQND
jgi:hypothetical protein